MAKLENLFVTMIVVYKLFLIMFSFEKFLSVLIVVIGIVSINRKAIEIL